MRRRVWEGEREREHEKESIEGQREEEHEGQREGQ